MPKVVVELEWQHPSKPEYHVYRIENDGRQNTFYKGPYKMSAHIGFTIAADEIEDYLRENNYYA